VGNANNTLLTVNVAHGELKRWVWGTSERAGIEHRVGGRDMAAKSVLDGMAYTLNSCIKRRLVRKEQSKQRGDTVFGLVRERVSSLWLNRRNR